MAFKFHYNFNCNLFIDCCQYSYYPKLSKYFKGWFPPKEFLKGKDPLKRELYMAGRLISHVSHVSNENPESLEDIKYLQQLDTVLNTSNSGIIIQKNGEILYYSPFLSSLDLDKETMNSKIQSFPNKKIINFSENIYLEKLDFRFPDESDGEAIIVIDLFLSR